MMRNLFTILMLLVCHCISAQAGTWSSELHRMPLGSNARELNRTNCVPLMLNAFPSNATVKALIFMPGATDELYFFRRVKVSLTNESPSLLDAVMALTNQSPLRATFRPPFLLLHSDEDVLDLIVDIQHPPTVAKLQQPVPCRAGYSMTATGINCWPSSGNPCGPRSALTRVQWTRGISTATVLRPGI
jgi:hypothetical protein